MRRLLPLSLMLALAGLFAAPALAQEAQAAQEETTTTTTAVAPADVPEPAVLVEVPPPKAETPDWTYRYLIPTGLVIGVASIFVTVVLYFVRVVRTRYRVVR